MRTGADQPDQRSYSVVDTLRDGSQLVFFLLPAVIKTMPIVRTIARRVFMNQKAFARPIVWLCFFYTALCNYRSQVWYISMHCASPSLPIAQRHRLLLGH